MARNFRVYAQVVTKILAIASEAGFDSNELCALVGIDPQELHNPDARVPVSAYQHILVEVTRRAGNDYFWLRDLGPEFGFGNHPLWYLLARSRNFGQMLERAESLYGILSDVIYPSCRVCGDECTVRVMTRTPDMPLNGPGVDWLLTIWWHTFRLYAGPALRLRCLRLTTLFSGRQMIYRRHFDVPVEINQPHIEMVFPASSLNLTGPPLERDPELEKLIWNILAPRSGAAPVHGDFLTDVRTILEQQLLHGQPNLNLLAIRLTMSPRSVQRKLAELGSSFQDQVHEARRKMATAYLKHPELTVAEIAHRVGFKDARSLTVAFQKWFGTTPTKYREQSGA